MKFYGIHNKTSLSRLQVVTDLPLDAEEGQLVLKDNDACLYVFLSGAWIKYTAADTTAVIEEVASEEVQSSTEFFSLLNEKWGTSSADVQQILLAFGYVQSLRGLNAPPPGIKLITFDGKKVYLTSSQVTQLLQEYHKHSGLLFS